MDKWVFTKEEKDRKERTVFLTKDILMIDMYKKHISNEHLVHTSHHTWRLPNTNCKYQTKTANNLEENICV